MTHSLVCADTVSRVSSVLNRNTRQFGKKHLFDQDEETCWNSDQGPSQWVILEFPQRIRVSQLQIQFQGCLSVRHHDLITDKFTESVYVLANEPSVALYRLQEHVRRSLPELAQHKMLHRGDQDRGGMQGEGDLVPSAAQGRLDWTFSTAENAFGGVGRAHARVVGSIPSGVHAGGSRSMILSHH
ncbi:hypothetical protein QTO34_015242 [Cnephaeus nilssonii]|uniref:Nuclear receptor 2C2-associated protein n=1 Tax=Cnephaeus nilssonii TaxID=3371016 RepID=A0AA40I4M3_CNENI|nr:hypothetical protein QTO34_015242 [Eptesicus nilssonii]